MRAAVVLVVFVLVVVFWRIQTALERRNRVIGMRLSPRLPERAE